MRFTPPRRARRRIAGLVIPWLGETQEQIGFTMDLPDQIGISTYFNIFQPPKSEKMVQLI